MRRPRCVTQWPEQRQLRKPSTSRDAASYSTWILPKVIFSNWTCPVILDKPAPVDPPRRLKMEESAELTDRQRREREYHTTHASRVRTKALGPINYDVSLARKRRWWNAHWDMYTFLRKLNVTGMRALVVGCGAGDDALQLAKLGAKVDAFDLSPDMLDIAREVAEREHLDISFQEAAAEQLSYADNSFDVIFVRDILHHVDISKTMSELKRVSKDGALLIVNEIYSHSMTDRVRYSRLVRDFLYPCMRRFVYQTEAPYITVDERKLTERDVELVQQVLDNVHHVRYFNFIVTRLIPDRLSTLLNKMDWIMLRTAGGLGKYIAGRIVFVGHIQKGISNWRNCGRS